MDDSPPPEPLLTLADLGARLHVRCNKAVRRALARAMANDPGLRVTLRGRSILFTPRQLARAIKALEWRPYVPGRAPRTVSVVRVGRAARPAQEAVHERIQGLLRQRKGRS